MDESAAAKALLSKVEQVLYGRLMRGFPGHLVLAHVALSRLLSLDARDAARHAVVDFIVCRADFTPLAVFGFAAAAASRDLSDLRRDELLRAAGIKVIPVPAEDIPCESALKALAVALPVQSPASGLLRRAS